MQHPNAFAGLITTGLAALLVKVANHYGYVHLSTEQALVAAGGAVTIVLFLGRRFFAVGLRGVLGGFWRGNKKPAPPPAPPTTVAPPPG